MSLQKIRTAFEVMDKCEAYVMNIKKMDMLKFL